MKLRLVTAPAIEPVTLTEVKTHCRVDGTADDTYLTSLIAVARRHIEAVELGRSLITQTWDYTVDAFPGGVSLALPRPRLQSIESIKYTDSDGTEYTVDSSTYYADTAAEPGLAVLKYGQSWPSATLRYTSAVTVRFTAGYGPAASDIPEPIRQAVLLLVAHLYEHREPVGDSRYAAGLKEIPFAIGALCAPYSTWWR